MNFVPFLGFLKIIRSCLEQCSLLGMRYLFEMPFLFSGSFVIFIT